MRWSLLFVLLALACKPAVRQAPESDLHAIADDSLTLGVTPVEKDDVQAYRLLVCKKAMSYPKWMLADESRCLPGLVTEEGDEVIILPDHLKRDFATKYKGYAKTAPVVVPAMVLAAVGAVLGVPRLGKLVTDSKAWDAGKNFVDKPGKYNIKTVWNNTTGKISGIIPEGMTKFFRGKIRTINRKTHELISKKWYLDFWSLSHQRTLARGEAWNKRLLNAMREKATQIDSAEQVRALRLEKELLQKSTGLVNVDSSVKSLGKNIEDLGGQDFLAKYRQAIPVSTGDNLVKTVKDTRSIHEIKANQRVSQLLQRQGVYDMTTRDKAIATRIKEIDELSVNKTLDEMIKDGGTYGPFGLTQNAIRVGGATGAVAAYGVMVSLDKSIWGYSDRQVSKHWSQIFHDQGDFGEDSASVRDLPGILKSLADAYGFTVNSKAIALGN